MAGIQANGIGSGLDINSLVSQLVAAEAAPLTQRVTRHETAVTTKISALASFKGALGAFKTALEPLRTLDVFQTRKASADKADFFTVSADATAVAGTYEVEVVNLASAHQLTSEPVVGGASSNVGYGKLTISSGSKSFEVDLAQGAQKLTDLRDAINVAGSSSGVQATLLNTTGGARLVLTTVNTGAVNAIKVTASGGDGGLNQFAYEVGVTENLTEQKEAKDAVIKVAGFAINSATNTFEDAIDGVTIVAKKSSAGEKVNTAVAFDRDAVINRVQNFVTQYNNLQTQLSKLGGYNADTKVGGPLLGDSLLRGVDDEVRRGITNPVSGASGNYATLAVVGVTTTATGTLQLDTAKLTAALQSDGSAVAKLFGSEEGIAARLYKKLEARLSTSSDLETRTTRLNAELKDISKDKEAVNARLTQIEARYRKQFTALDTLLSKMQSTASYLAQQLGTSSG